MKTFSSSEILERIKKAYNLKTDIEVADLLGINKTTLSNWKARNSIDLQLVFSKCEHINADWLLKGEGESRKTESTVSNMMPYVSENLVKVRFLDISPTASFTEIEAIPVQDYDYKYILPMPGEEISEKDVVFPVYGDSMEPQILNHAEVLGKYIRKSQWHWAKGVVLISYDNSFVIKRILENKLDQENFLILGSDNPLYPQTVKVSLDSIHAMFKADRIVSSPIH